MSDPDFEGDREALAHAVHLLTSGTLCSAPAQSWPATLPDVGIGGRAALDVLAPVVIGGAAHLGNPMAFAHMDPPTPWITWATAMWNAALNQNLLHPATAPAARAIEQQVIDWLAPCFGMKGGHILPGATLANLTALWAARECAGIEEVVHSANAHLSIPKAAHILGLRARSIPVAACQKFSASDVSGDLSRSAVVLTAGTTSTGLIDDLTGPRRAAWTHVDAAWAGPLRLSHRHAGLLTGIEQADSVAVSAHKWLFQPKECAMVLFLNPDAANPAISFEGAYLAAPNIGILGSHGAAAVPLMATLLAWGRQGVAKRIERCMLIAQQIAAYVKEDDRLQLLDTPHTGVVVWRPKQAGWAERLQAALPRGTTSVTALEDGLWLRNVAANPNFEPNRFIAALQSELAA